MCGIAGFQGTFPADLLGRMTQAIAHRGPDGEGTCALGHGRAATGLGHRRLAIIDLSAEGHQPMTVDCPACGAHGLADLVLTYNGEVYNYRELRAELAARGHAFHSATDSEVLLHLYAEQGTRMLARLNGIFAFALRDGRPSGQRDGMRPGDLLVVRDPIGVKPLYHAQTPDGTLFASEMKALLQYEKLPQDLDPVAIHQTLAYLWCPAPRTALASVRKLPPGTAMVIRDGSPVRQWAYYDLPYRGERSSLPADAIAAQLREEVANAVERQLVADVPVGAFLSGGLDSSSVVAMMRRARPDLRPTCYCIGWADPSAIEGHPDDLPYARRVARYLDVDLREIQITPSISERLEEVIWQLDEPQADPAPINALLIAEAARRDGMKVLLSGAGGDDIFTGYRRHTALAHERMWTWLPAPARRAVAAAAGRLASGGGALDLRNPLARRLAKAFAYADQPADRRLATFFWWSTEAVRRGLYSPAFAAQVAGEDTAAPMLESLARIPAERDPMQRLLYLEGKHFLPDHNLNYTDKAGMAAGVEVRVPLLDLELVEFAAKIPTHMKQRGREGKAIFKRAMEPLLPHDVIYRGKTGFGAPLRRWLGGELKPLVDETLSAVTLGRRGLFDPAAVARLVDLDRRGRVDGAYTIFALMCIEIWCRRFVDRAGSATRDR